MEAAKVNLPKGYEAPCKCSSCLNSFRSEQLGYYFKGYSTKFSDDEAKSIAAGHLKTINDDREYLRQHWTSLGESIVGRWKNKSAKQKATCLKRAEPKLYEKSWFTLRAHTGDVKFRNQSEASKYRTEFLLDYMNVDGLKRDYVKLLGLVQNRALSTPEQWAEYDNQRIYYPWHFGMVDIKFSALCMVMHGPEFGTLTKWEANAAHRGDLLGFPRAQLFLEAQATELGILRKVVEQLVEGLDLASAQDNPEPLPQLELKSLGRHDLWSTYTNQPFCSPPTFDSNSVLEKAQSRLGMSGDHLWLLQTDPDYLREAIRVVVNGLPSKHPKEHIFNVVALTVSRSIWHFWSWNLIVTACKNVQEMEKKYVGCIGPGESLPDDYEQTFKELQFVLNSRVDDHRDILAMSLTLRAKYHEDFKYNYVNQSTIVDISSKLKLAGILERDPVFYALHTLISPGTILMGFVEYTTLWSFLEETLATKQIHAKRLDEELYTNYADYAAAQELQFALQFHRPQPAKEIKELLLWTKEEAAKLGAWLFYLL